MIGVAIIASAHAEPPMPLPLPRPAAPTERQSTPTSPAPSTSHPPELSAAEVDACRTALESQGARLDPLPPISDGPCGLAHPFRLSRLSQAIVLEPPIVTSCPVASALAAWTETSIAVAAATYLGGARPSAIHIGTSYQCRNENGGATAKLSEHAFGDAIDLAGWGFVGHAPLSVADHPPDGSAEAGFLAEARRSACRHFTTVLGPGSDEAHATHMHLDLRQRRSGYRICQ